ncbi:MAG: phosphoribosylanthranilate isomerase [Gammaproteobacteria bacterium]|nr:phosphoribosylanthranilate isomerase [Gammaproteobacteria bacterium]
MSLPSHHRTRIKICGITRPEDALEAARLGADAVGLVLYPPSPRAIDVVRAARIRDVLPPFVQPVALFVNPTEAEVEAVLKLIPEVMLQFHGSETHEFCASFGRPYLKALPMGRGCDPVNEAARHARASGFLLDSHDAGGVGGTGQTFDWSTIPALQRPLVLAGGLRPENVGQAVRSVRPWAVDVSSGVECAPGIKDPARMAAFINEVRHADRSD